MNFPAFWDTSAIVPLCVKRHTSDEAIAHFGTWDLVVWWAAPVELAGALARLLRMNELNFKRWREAVESSQRLAKSWEAIPPSASLLDRAVQVVGTHDLRAANALQLSAAPEWCHDKPSRQVFLTADRRLNEAASATGFTVKLLL